MSGSAWRKMVLELCHVSDMLCAGSSDPYVQLTLLPQWKYGSKKTYKTQVEKSTLDPYFNKEFSMYEILPPSLPPSLPLSPLPPPLPLSFPPHGSHLSPALSPRRTC